MADILCLQGAAAFSAFRLQRLVDRLQVVLPKMVALRADYWHVVEVKRVLSDAERAQRTAHHAGKDRTGDCTTIVFAA